MSLRLKILALACVILVAFAIATGFSTYQLRQVSDEIGSIVDYHITLTALVSEIDVITDEYELNIRRLLHHTGDPDRLRAIARRQAEITARLPAIFDRSRSLLANSAVDPRNDPPDRIRLARIDGTLHLLGRQVAPFLALGRSIQIALEQRRVDDAWRAAQEFSKYEQAFGSDIAEVRQAISELTHKSTQRTEQRQRSALWFSGLLFVLAAVVGLGSVALLAHRLAQAFHRLLDATREVEAGRLGVEVAATSRDEIGQLTEAFNK
jgi:methyl-accepting chemotaxis protein